MKEKKIAWLVTHDAYIDRRILFFADVLMENGYSVKLFPSAYTDFTNDSDPDYVVRPLDWNVVKLYALSLDALMEEERGLITHVIDAQEAYHRENGTYACALELLAGMEKTRRGYTLQTVGERSGYFISIQRGNRVLVYDSHTGHTTVISDKRTGAQAGEYERAIVGADLKEIDTQGYTTVGDVALSYTKGPRGRALAAHCKTADNGVWLFNNDPPELYRGTPIPLSPVGPDTLGEKQFDFQDFRKILFEYSPILKQVRRALPEETPDLVYVADLPTLPIGVMLKEVLGCTLMVDCHEWWYKQTRLWESTWAEKIALAEKSEAELYPKCDVCITVGKYLAQDMSACYHKHFDVIYSCMSAALRLEDTVPEADFWHTYGIPDGTRIAIFQGSMTALRNLDNLARATRYLEDDCRLVVVGGGDYQEKFLHTLEKEGNPERVVMVGWVNQSELLRFTVNADLGVLPYSAVDEYYSYAVPNKLMEYFEATLPMLYDVSMKEVSMVAGEHGVGVGEDLSDPVKFGQTLNRLLHDEEQLSAMKKQYEGCRNKFSFESQRAALETVLGEHGLIERV